LDDYVNRENPLYEWNVIESFDYPEYTVTVLNLTSQEWMDGNLLLYGQDFRGKLDFHQI